MAEALLPLPLPRHFVTSTASPSSQWVLSRAGLRRERLAAAPRPRRLKDSTLCNPAEIGDEDEDEDEGSIFLHIPQDWLFSDKKTVGLSAFSRIAPSCPIIADVVTIHGLFDVLTCPSGGRLHFLIYGKYLKSLDRSVKGITQSPPASGFRSLS